MLPHAGAVGRPHATLKRTIATLAILAIATLTACSAHGSEHGDDDGATPALASVTPIDDPQGYVGATHVVAASSEITPVTTGEQTLPVTITDAQGESVTITDTSRILALDIYGSLARIVYELGFGDQLVGRDISTAFPEARDLPLVTENGHDLSAEAILDLAPTIIITDTSLGPWDVVLQMRDAGITVVTVDSKRKIETIGTLVDQVASALGVPQRGTELSDRVTAEVTAKVDEIAAVAPEKTEDKLRMVFLYVRGNSGVYYLFGEESGADTLIEALGGIDVAGELDWSGMRPITDEAIIAANPDVLLMMTGGLESAGGVDGLLEHLPALAQTQAGQNKRIVDMSDATIMSFGPNTAAVLDALAVGLYAPEATK